MSSERVREVIVIGGGPAGAMAAYHLARSKVDVLLLDQDFFPRSKPCAGAVTEKVLRLLDMDVGALIEDRCVGLQSSLQGKAPFFHESDQPLAYQVRREEFDHALLNQAREQGAEVHEGVRVKEVRTHDRGVEVVAGKRDPGGEGKAERSPVRFQARFIAGADGVNSAVARSLNLRRDMRLARAMVCEMHPSNPAELNPFRGLVTMDFGVVPRGYGWVFPKRESLNVGVYTLNSRLRGLRGLLDDYLRFRFPNLGPEELALIKASNHFLPSGGKREALHSSRGVLLGDAAGLVDSLTGEGIYYALRSGELAAQYLGEAVKQDSTALLADYTDRIHQEMLSNFRASQIISRIFYGFPGISYRLLTQAPVVAGYKRTLRKFTVRGEVPYNHLIREFFSGGFFHRGK